MKNKFNLYKGDEVGDVILHVALDGSEHIKMPCCICESTVTFEFLKFCKAASEEDFCFDDTIFACLECSEKLSRAGLLHEARHEAENQAEETQETGFVFVQKSDDGEILAELPLRGEEYIQYSCDGGCGKSWEESIEDFYKQDICTISSRVTCTECKERERQLEEERWHEDSEHLKHLTDEKFMEENE
jgi:hypothetical protein